MDLEFIAVPAIVAVVYLLAEIMKDIFKSESFLKALPAICGALGGAWGILCWFVLPGFIPAENWFVALAVGIASGFAATGVHQVYKQNSPKE